MPKLLSDAAVAQREVSEDRELVPVKKQVNRALSLDALRGLAILGMVLSGLVPYGAKGLPAWMYHAQTPPPSHVYNPAIIGLTWVDFVFPLFLFSLGSAVPLALGLRLDAGVGRLKLATGAIGRGLLLLFFALYRMHTASGLLVESYGDVAWWLCVLAFVLLFPVFMRLPRQMPAWSRWGVRLAGWVAVGALLYSLEYADGSGFSVHRHDIILVILANVAVTTSLVWLWLGTGYTGRLCLMGLLVALHLARRFSHWGMPITDLQFLKPLVGDRWFDGVFWAVAPAYQKYLLITIPGTIAGDALAEWLRPGAQRLSFKIQNSRWRDLSPVRCLCLAVVSVAVVICVITGLAMADVTTTAGVAVLLSALGLSILYSPPARSRLKRARALRGQLRVNALVFRTLFGWGIVWLLLGLALYPYQGGIRKDPATLSYLFTTAGLAHMALVALTVITDAMHRPGALFLLVGSGQNPMIAYVAGGMIILPILHLLPGAGGGSAMDWLLAISSSHPWLGFVRAVGLTLVVALFVTALTRLRIYWRT